MEEGDVQIAFLDDMANLASIRTPTSMQGIPSGFLGRQTSRRPFSPGPPRPRNPQYRSCAAKMLASRDFCCRIICEDIGTSYRNPYEWCNDMIREVEVV